MISKATLGIAAAGAGICFIGYCIYFDKKRRSDPLFKTRLRERRKKAKELKPSSSSSTEFPNLSDPQAMQRFFLQEVQLGEELLAGGEIEEGVEHLANAVAVCGQPQQLLQVLQQTLAPQIFQLLLQKLPAVSQKLTSLNATPKGATITPVDDDLE